MKRLAHDRQTTLITGASAGLGAEFARQLAARGSDLVLVARRADRLTTLAASLRETYGVQAHALPADLARPGPGDHLLDETCGRGIDVTAVVNNAGFGMWGRFHEADPARLREMIAVDVTAVTDISRAFLPRLRESGDGYLLNVTSVAAYSSIAMQGAYSAAKAYVLSLTEALWAESQGTGVRVLAFAPGVTDTEFFEVVGSSDADGGSPHQTPARVVASALRVLDRRNPPPSWVSGHGNHALTVLPRWFTRRRAAALTAARTMRDIVPS